MNDNRPHILITDDSATIRKVIIRQISDNYITHEAENGEKALELIHSNPEICFVFVDMHMPGMNGMVLLNKIRNDKDARIASLPVIIITGHEDSIAAKRASQNIGATDFIGKPFDSFDIISSVETYAKTPEKKDVDIHSTASDDQSSSASINVKTNLPDEEKFLEYGERTLQNSHADSSVLYMQIAGISDILNEHGELTAAQIIKITAKHISKSLRKDEMLAHRGSDKFSLILPGTNEFKANIVAIRIQKLISNLKFAKGESAIRIKLAIGIDSTANENSDFCFNDICEQADDALQQSIKHPKCAIIRYDETDEKRLSDNNARLEQSSNANASPTSADRTENSELHFYLQYAISGEFDKIPSRYLEQMIEPMENLLDYANNKSTRLKQA